MHPIHQANRAGGHTLSANSSYTKTVIMCILASSSSHEPGHDGLAAGRPHRGEGEGGGVSSHHSSHQAQDIAGSETVHLSGSCTFQYLQVTLDRGGTSATFSPFLALIFLLISLSPNIAFFAAFAAYPDFASDVLEAFLGAFGTFTFIIITISLCLGAINAQGFFLLGAKVLPKLSKITLAKNLKLPRIKGEFSLYIIFFAAGNILNCYGLLNTISPNLPQYSFNFKISLIFIPVLVILTVALIFEALFDILIIAWSSHIVEKCETVENSKRENIEDLTRECLKLYQQFNEEMGPTLFFLYSGAQISWISFLYNAMVILSPTNVLNTVATVQLTAGFTAYALMFLMLLKILTFQLDKQYQALRGLARTGILSNFHTPFLLRML